MFGQERLRLKVMVEQSNLNQGWAECIVSARCDSPGQVKMGFVFTRFHVASQEMEGVEKNRIEQGN
jgi:hypothetical protein